MNIGSQHNRKYAEDRVIGRVLHLFLIRMKIVNHFIGSEFLFRLSYRTIIDASLNVLTVFYYL